MLKNHDPSKKLKLAPGAAFHEHLAADWSAAYARGSFSRRLRYFMSILDHHVESDHSWVDLGCGSGVLTKELLDRGALVVAVDGSPHMLSQARTYVGAGYGSMLTWIEGDVQHLSGIPDGSMDGVLCSSVVEYVDNPSVLLSEVARVLRPHGILIISMPPRLSVVRTAQKVVRRIARAFSCDKYPYLAVSGFEVGPLSLAQWLDEAGLTLDCITKFDPILPRILLTIFRPALLIVEAHRMSGLERKVQR